MKIALCLHGYFANAGGSEASIEMLGVAGFANGIRWGVIRFQILN